MIDSKSGDDDLDTSSLDCPLSNIDDKHLNTNILDLAKSIQRRYTTDYQIFSIYIQEKPNFLFLGFYNHLIYNPLQHVKANLFLGLFLEVCSILA